MSKRTGMFAALAALASTGPATASYNPLAYYDFSPRRTDPAVLERRQKRRGIKRARRKLRMIRKRRRGWA